MSICEQVRAWNTNEAERTAGYACDAYAAAPFRRYVRAVDVDAPRDVTFRWLCQLKVAPYSYDWLDNLGRRSPTRLTPGAERLAVGQRLMIGPIVEFEIDRHITLVTGPRATRLFGPLAITYQVSETTGSGRTRLVACLDATARSPLGRLRRAVLGAGDLVMMRKELLTLKAHAERQHRQAVA